MILDYSYARPNPAAMKAAGAVGVMRYLSPTPGKNLSATERDALHAVGLTIGLVWESTATRAGQGFAAGQWDAQAANAQADALGYPLACPIFYAVDFSTTAATVGPYFQGVASVGHRPVGVYGSAQIVDDVPVPWKWQTVAWSGGRISAAAHLYQHNTPSPIAGTDVNDLLKPLPMWAGASLVNYVTASTPSTPATPAGSAPAPLIATEEIDMLVIRDAGNGSIALIGESYVGEFAGDDMAGVQAAVVLWGDVAPDGTRGPRNLVHADYVNAVSRAQSRMGVMTPASASPTTVTATVDPTMIETAVKAALAGLTVTVVPAP